MQFFLVKFQKKTKNQFFKSIFWTFFPLYTWVLFRHTWQFFCQNQKNSLKVPKEMIIVLITFVIFSQSFAEDTWNALLATLPSAIYFLPKDGFFSLRDWKRSNKYSSLQKKTLKLSAAPVGCSFEQFWQKIHTKSPIISLNDQTTWSKFLHLKETSWNCSLEHFECSCDNPAGFFF